MPPMVIAIRAPPGGGKSVVSSDLRRRLVQQRGGNNDAVRICDWDAYYRYPTPMADAARRFNADCEETLRCDDGIVIVAHNLRAEKLLNAALQAHGVTPPPLWLVLSLVPDAMTDADAAAYARVCRERVMRRQPTAGADDGSTLVVGARTHDGTVLDADDVARIVDSLCVSMLREDACDERLRNIAHLPRDAAFGVDTRADVCAWAWQQVVAAVA